MAIAEKIQFEGPQDALVWKHPAEDFNASSQLIVDATHEAILVVNGQDADLFTAGRRTLSVPNIPFARKLIEIPTDGESPFSCKVFFINKVHNMDLRWGTDGPLPLEDPWYDVFLHIMAHGSMTVCVEDSRKFLLKMVGFRDRFDNNELIGKFRGIISSFVKDCIAKIMIDGFLGYFTIGSHLLDLSKVLKERLEPIFMEYGIRIELFTLETVEVPDDDYRMVAEAKKRRTSRLIEGYTWWDERQMMIAEKFAGNEGAIGAVGGAVGGFMVGGAIGTNVADIAREALDRDRHGDGIPPKDAGGTHARASEVRNDIDVMKFLRKDSNSEEEKTETEGKRCPRCGAALPEKAKFCLNCGEAIPQEDTVVCPGCGKSVPRGKYCVECGRPLTSDVCPNCGEKLPEGAKFCLNCGTKI